MPPDVRIFFALGDPTRLLLLERLRGAPALSTTALTEGLEVSRQAITKHLEVLAEAGLVRDVRRGRERLWEVDGRSLREVAAWLEGYRERWEAGP